MSKKALMIIFVNLISYIIVLTTNVLANTLPIGGMTTGEISAMFPNLFTPAPFTFGIWGLIYLLLGGFVIRQLLEWIKQKQLSVEVRQICWLFALSSIMNCLWIFAWHYLLIPLSFFIMLLLLGTLMVIYQRIRHIRRKPKFLDLLTIDIPFSVYLGWITVASLANLTTLLVYFRFNGMGPLGIVWACIMIVIATLIGNSVLSTYKDIYYPLVIIWALFGILVQRLMAPERVYTIIVFTLVAMLVLIFRIFKYRNRRVYFKK